jgi:hypothetical protein
MCFLWGTNCIQVFRIKQWTAIFPRVEAGKNTSTVTLRVLRGDGSSIRWDSNVWLWVLRDSDHWQIALQITDPSSRQRGRPKTKSKGIFRRKKGKYKIWSWTPKGVPHTKTNWLTDRQSQRNSDFDVEQGLPSRDRSRRRTPSNVWLR